MVYSKQTWVDGSAGGTPINESRLNHIEVGLEAVSNEAVTDAELATALATQTVAQSQVTGLTSSLSGINSSLAGKVTTGTSGLKLDSGTTLPAAGQVGRLFVLHP